MIHPLQITSALTVHHIPSDKIFEMPISKHYSPPNRNMAKAQMKPSITLTFEVQNTNKIA